MAKLTPRKVTVVSDEEVPARSFGRAFKWGFDPKVFDGQWYRIEVGSDLVASAMNSYRNQAKYRGHLCELRRAEGALYARTITEEDLDAS